MSSTHSLFCPLTKRSLWVGQGHGKDFNVTVDREELKKFLKDHYGLPLVFCDKDDYYQHADDMGVHHLNPEDYEEYAFTSDAWAENEKLRERVTELENDLDRVKMLWVKVKQGTAKDFVVSARAFAAMENLLK